VSTIKQRWEAHAAKIIQSIGPGNEKMLEIFISTIQSAYYTGAFDTVDVFHTEGATGLARDILIIKNELAKLESVDSTNH
jgi:hypothetical protein